MCCYKIALVDQYKPFVGLADHICDLSTVVFLVSFNGVLAQINAKQFEPSSRCHLQHVAVGLQNPWGKESNWGITVPELSLMVGVIILKKNKKNKSC